MSRKRFRARRRRRGQGRPLLRRGNLLWAGLAGVAAIIGLIAYLSTGGVGGEPAVALPRWVLTKPAPVREAYVYAVERPDILSRMPCYCGCVSVGHANNADCFVDRRLPDGSIVYERHGST